MKHEIVDLDVLSGDEIPSVVNYQRVSEFEEEKSKMKLLWSLCQEELTVQSEISKNRSRIAELQKNLGEEVNLSVKLGRRISEITERKKVLIESARFGQID